ncbi:methyltransferase domain-containing protein [Streptomyces alkaliphilus]|uniref:Methyltransferase domain-containing protein n=1 Tax=Streptomyces alkaliphilus TaxID=1472722 RepID=A0A7W3Y061_9ACTN|nr:class I SAM-dependent methyltransferase [Streptomyces alkaliphilus]MBB0243073.1 methyltransferase domain-containing protein [Streptomyces alkaliphilus]
MTDSRSAAWDAYARRKSPRRRTNARGETTWFNWTQYPDHGPGTEVLAVGSGDHVLDLGCGTGGNAAHLATLGVRAVGVDLSAARLAGARERWADAEGMELHRGDALAFLAAATTPYRAIYSVFGAAYFTEPRLMLPAVHGRLVPGGVFALSQYPPVEGCYGCQASYIPRGFDEDPAIVKRWDHPPESWIAMLEEHGFRDVTAGVLPAPARGRRRIGTLLVRGVRV